MKKKHHHSRIHRRVYEKKAEFHDKLIRRVFENPELLGIEGLNSKSLVLKEIEPSDINNGSIDLLFVYLSGNNCEILLAEGKAGLYKALKKADFQLYWAFKVASEFEYWSSLIQKIQDSGIILNPDYQVWLDTIKFYTEDGVHIQTTKPLRYKRKKKFLGLVGTGLSTSSCPQ